MFVERDSIKLPLKRSFLLTSYWVVIVMIVQVIKEGKQKKVSMS